MRALVLGARGAVGQVVVDELRMRGHEVIPAGRTPSPGWAQLDLAGADGLSALRELSDGQDVVVNASGVEDARIGAAVSKAILVDVSATAAYLDGLGRSAPSGTGIVRGAGLVPGLSTILLTALGALPDDEVDLAVVLGGGETHGPAALAWTAALAGRSLYDPPEAGIVRNLWEGRRLPGAFGSRRHLRADFPDHLLVGAPNGYAVRTYLATDSRISTTALALVGRMPWLRGLVAHAPHLGGDEWSLTAIDRRSRRAVTATGRGQSRATGVLTAHIAEAAERLRPDRPVNSAELLDIDDVRGIDGIRLL